MIISVGFLAISVCNLRCKAMMFGHQWFEIRLLWDHHSCEYQIFTGGSPKNNFMLFWTLWMLFFAKLVQCIISLSFKKLGNFSLFLYMLYYTTGMNFILQHLRHSFLEYINNTQRHSHDDTLPLPLPLTKPMAAIGWCPSECAKLHLLVPHLFAGSRKWGIVNPIPDAERGPAEIKSFLHGSSAFPNFCFLLGLFYPNYFFHFLL